MLSYATMKKYCKLHTWASNKKFGKCFLCHFNFFYLLGTFEFLNGCFYRKFCIRVYQIAGGIHLDSVCETNRSFLGPWQCKSVFNVLYVRNFLYSIFQFIFRDHPGMYKLWIAPFFWLLTIHFFKCLFVVCILPIYSLKFRLKWGLWNFELIRCKTNVPEVLNVHINEIYKKLTRIK